MLPKNTRPYGHRWIVLRTSLAHDRACSREVRKCGRDILVRNADLFFERIQFRVLEGLPPFTVQRSVFRLGYLPAVHFFQVFGRNFLKTGRCLCAGSVVFWAYISALEQPRRRNHNANRATYVPGSCLHARLSLLENISFLFWSLLSVSSISFKGLGALQHCV